MLRLVLVLSLMEISATEDRTPCCVEPLGHQMANSRQGIEVNLHVTTNYPITLYYSWEGEHPREDGVSQYFGAGEIVFHPGFDEVVSKAAGLVFRIKGLWH
jgi:hypothetical protein